MDRPPPAGTTTTTVPHDDHECTTRHDHHDVPGGLPTDPDGLLDLADQLYDEAREAQRTDDWATYGEQIERLGQVIAALQALENAAP